MIRLAPFSLAVGLMLALGATPSSAADTNATPAPDFNEVYNLVRQHISEVNEANLNRAAVEGLISSLGPKVAWVKQDASGHSAEAALVSKTNWFDGKIGYLRIGKVAEGLAGAVHGAYEQLTSTNPLNGLILDLRYTGGQDYAAAVATVDLFLAKDKPLLDWGQGLVQSKEKADALALPTVLLVNRQTEGAAEAMAAVLRHAGAGLILGSRTAGQAMVARDFPLKNGDRLRIMTSPIRLGDGSELSTDGVKPDIGVSVSPQAERAYFADAFKDPARTNATASVSGTNAPSGLARARRPRFNEAELVRERREGYNPDADSTDGADGDADTGVVRDPALARAIDVLKGLALVRSRNP